MVSSPSEDAEIEVLRQQRHELWKEEEALLNVKREFENSIAENFDSSTRRSNRNEEIARLKRKVANLRSQLKEIPRLEDQTFTQLEDSVNDVKRKIESVRSETGSNVKRRDDGAILDELLQESQQLEVEEHELISTQQCLVSKIADVEKQLSRNGALLGDLEQAILNLKEKIKQNETDLEELAGEKALKDAEMKARLAKSNAAERGNCLFAELHDRKLAMENKVGEIKMKLYEATVELEWKKAELQRKTESREIHHIGIETERMAHLEEYRQKIQALNDKVDGLSYKFKPPKCKFQDSCSRDFEWVRVALERASEEEFKAFRDYEGLSHAVVGLTEVIVRLEDQIGFLEMNRFMLTEK